MMTRDQLRDTYSQFNRFTHDRYNTVVAISKVTHDTNSGLWLVFYHKLPHSKRTRAIDLVSFCRKYSPQP